MNSESIFIPPYKKFSTKSDTSEQNVSEEEINKKELDPLAEKNSEIQISFNLEHIKELNYIFDENLIFPKFHEYNSLLPGCTNILKETTKQYLNISLMENSVYNKFSDTIKIFNEKFFLKADQDSINSKKPISGNFNEAGKKILNDKLTNGKSIYIILEDLINLIISTKINNVKDTNNQFSNENENSESNIYLIASQLNINLKEISKENWKQISTEKKLYIMGLLIVSSGFFNVLRNGSIAMHNNNPKDICKIIKGGHLTGKNISNVIFLKDKCTKLEKVSNNNLKKLNSLNISISSENKFNNNKNIDFNIIKNNPLDSDIKFDNALSRQNSVANTNNDFSNNNCNFTPKANLIDLINIKEMINAIDSALDIYKENPKSEINKNIIFFLLKFFSLFTYEDIICNKGKKDNLSEIFNKLNLLTENEKWIEKTEEEWELEFVDSWQTIYTKLDKNSNLIYSPSKSFMEELKNLFDSNTKSNKELSKTQNYINSESEPDELISKLTMPDSSYGSDLPKLKDYSKCTLALKNIQNFERYTVEEIFRYCANTYKDYEYLNSLSQIRYHLSNNDTSSAKTDIYYIFDQTKVPTHMPLPKEQRDMREIFKEECYPGNYYLAKINSRIARESGINYLLKLINLGLNEIPVLVLLVDTSLNLALVQFDDYMDQTKINSFWIQLDNLFSLDYHLKLPASSFKLNDLLFEYDYFQKNLIKLYAKNILINLNRYNLNLNTYNLSGFHNMLLSNSTTNNLENVSSNQFNMMNLIHFLNLEFWQLNKISPINGIFSCFKNYIKVNQIDELSLKTKESFINNDSTQSIDINNVLQEINYSKKSKLDQPLNNPSLQNSYENRIEVIEKYLSEICNTNEESLKLLNNWCFESWQNLLKETKHLRFDIFKEYKTLFNNMRTKEQFNLGNMGNKLIALHELSNINSESYCGIILSFEQTAILGPNAKLSFYSDKDGVNLIYEITSIKNTMSNLQSIIFNQSKIWMNYTPGTRAFYIHDWHLQTRDSELPCCLSFIPHYWSSLIWITDFSTNCLFSRYNFNNLEIFKDFIKKLLGLCSSTKIPVDLQRNIFSITNRIILKANKYIQELHHRKLINFDSLSLYEKMNMIGIDEFFLIELIKHIDRFNNNSGLAKDKNFSSSYVVDGVEIILSILSVIKESYHNLDFYMKENFDYSLPIWIEAIIKLGQFLNLFQNVSQLENELSREIKNEVIVKDQIYDVLIIKNIPGYIDNKKIIKEIKRLCSSFNLQICDVDIDIAILDKNIEKLDLIIKDISEEDKNALFNVKIETKENAENKKENSTELKSVINDKDKDEAIKDSNVTEENSKNKNRNKNKFANIDKNYTKELFILIDGVKVETLKEIAETTEQEEVSSLWICAGCDMENDMENMMCIFCDKEKIIKPKEKKKKTLMKVDSYNFSVNDIINDFKNSLKNNTLFNTFTYEIPIENEIEKNDEQADKEKNSLNENKIEEKLKEENSIDVKPKENTTNEIEVNSGSPNIVLETSTNKEQNKSNENIYKFKMESIVKELEVSTPEEIKKNISNFSENISEFYKIRLCNWIKSNENELEEKINFLKFKKPEAKIYLETISYLINIHKKAPELFNKILINQQINLSNISGSNNLDNEINNENEEFEKIKNINFLNLMTNLEENRIDMRFEITELNENQLRENINLEKLEKIREIIDLNICKETNISFVFPPKAIRFINENLNSINCFTDASIKKSLHSSHINLAKIRYYWSIIKYFNNCLLAALPFIKPPDMNSYCSVPKDGEFTYIPFQKSISAFLSSAKGLTFSFIKQNLIREVISYTEFPEEQIQIPTFKFERLNIFNNLSEDKNLKKKAAGEPAFIRNDNFPQGSSDNNNNISIQNENEEDENLNSQKDLKIEESMFLQAYEQYKDIDIAFFRSKKSPGDPHICFKVEFKGELVQGIGGPYRQFFSDISLELQPKDVKGNTKILKLLYPSSNNQAEKGDYKDKFVIRPIQNDNNILNQLEFLGVLMGVCIRTGVHLTLDLCSIFWKKLVNFFFFNLYT